MTGTSTGFPASGTIRQVLSATKSDTQTYSTGSGVWTDITGLSITITPATSSNKVLIRAFLQFASASTNSSIFRFMRNATPIGIGDAAGNRTRISSAIYSSTHGIALSCALEILDSPATSSAVTYKVQMAMPDAAGTVYVNRGAADTDTAAQVRAASTITAFEVIV